jgi:tetratricopeptide (TPR) repeat protein
MEAPTPIPKPAVGKTFLVAISILGVVAIAELVAVGRVFLVHPRPLQAPVQETKLDLGDTFIPPPAPAPTAPPGPTPVPQVPQVQPTPVPETKSAVEVRVAELIEQAMTLRDRGDTSTALIRLREALTSAPNSPQIIAELAITYEKMGLNDKALDQWRRIYDIGESAGIYYSAAEAKIKSSESPTPAPEPSPQELVGLQPGAVLGLMDIAPSQQVDTAGTRIVSLKIPVKRQPNNKIDVSDVVIQVFFYDSINESIVQTNANVSSHWSRLPADWVDNDIEILEVEYSQPPPESALKPEEIRKYYGYVVRVYYKKELQDIRAEPVKLLKQFPPPVTLTDGAK